MNPLEQLIIAAVMKQSEEQRALQAVRMLMAALPAQAERQVLSRVMPAEMPMERKSEPKREAPKRKPERKAEPRREKRATPKREAPKAKAASQRRPAEPSSPPSRDIDLHGYMAAAIRAERRKPQRTGGKRKPRPANKVRNTVTRSLP